MVVIINLLYLAEMCNAELVNSDDRQPSSPSLNESQLQNHKENAINSLPPIESEDNYNLSFNHDLIDMTVTNPMPKSNNSNHANSPESLIPQSQSSLETTSLVNIGGSSNNTTNENGCAIAIQVDEDYDDEENEDDISETVALTQKFDKSRTKKN